MASYVVYEVEVFIPRIVANIPRDINLIREIARRAEACGEEAVDAEEVSEAVEGGAAQLSFLRDSVGIYLVERNIKGLMKETARMTGRRISELVRHGLTVLQEYNGSLVDKLYLRRGDGSVVSSADGVITRVGRVVTMRGVRTIVKEAEYLENVVLPFVLKVIPYIDKRLGGENGIREIFEYGETIGIGGDRSLGEGKYVLKKFRKVK